MRLTTRGIKRLHQLLQRNYPRLNCGGCAIFAYAFVSRIGGEAYYATTWRDEVATYDYHFPTDLNQSGMVASTASCGHAVVKYNGKWFDGHKFMQEIWRDGERQMVKDGGCHYYVSKQPFSKAEILTSLIEADTWNDFFIHSCDCRNIGDAICQFSHYFDRIIRGFSDKKTYIQHGQFNQ